jgi:hypothetical protein
MSETNSAPDEVVDVEDFQSLLDNGRSAAASPWSRAR